MTGTDLRPVVSTWQWNIRRTACFRRTNIGNAYSGRDLRYRSYPHELMQILVFQKYGGISPRANSEGITPRAASVSTTFRGQREALRMHHSDRAGRDVRADGCRHSARTMRGTPITAGSSQKAIGGRSLQSGRFLPLST